MYYANYFFKLNNYKFALTYFINTKIHLSKKLALKFILNIDIILKDIL